MIENLKICALKHVESIKSLSVYTSASQNLDNLLSGTEQVGKSQSFVNSEVFKDANSQIYIGFEESVKQAICDICCF